LTYHTDDIIHTTHSVSNQTNITPHSPQPPSNDGKRSRRRKDIRHHSNPQPHQVLAARDIHHEHFIANTSTQQFKAALAVPVAQRRLFFETYAAVVQ